MLVLGEETEVYQLYVETGIDVHTGVVTHLDLVLYGELSECGIEVGGVVRRIVTQVHANLRVHGAAKPTAVVVEVVVEGQSRHGNER